MTLEENPGPGGRIRLLAFADEPPPLDAAELVAGNPTDAVVTLGDLPADWIASLGGVDLPRLGVHGNHDGEHELMGFGIRDLHLSRSRVGEWSFAGHDSGPAHANDPTG